MCNCNSLVTQEEETCLYRTSNKKMWLNFTQNLDFSSGAYLQQNGVGECWWWSWWEKNAQFEICRRCDFVCLECRTDTANDEQFQNEQRQDESDE